MLYVKNFTKYFTNSVCFDEILVALFKTFVKIDYLSSNFKFKFPAQFYVNKKVNNTANPSL